MESSLATDRALAWLSGAFSLLAALLAGLGIYGVLAQAVSSRTREIGIRVALGADRARIVRMVVCEMAVLAGAGAAGGLAAVLALSRFVRSQLYQIEPADPATLAASAAGIAAVAVLAGYYPVLRATRIDPVRALRYE